MPGMTDERLNEVERVCRHFPACEAKTMALGAAREHRAELLAEVQRLRRYEKWVRNWWDKLPSGTPVPLDQHSGLVELLAEHDPAVSKAPSDAEQKIDQIREVLAR